MCLSLFFFVLSMLLFWFSCRMFSSLQRTLKNFKKKMGFLSIQLLPFSVVFFLSLFTWKKKRKGQKRKRKVHLIFYFSPSPLPPFHQFLHSQKYKEYSGFFGVFFTEHTHGKRVSLLVLRGGGGEEGSWERTARVGQGFSVHGTGQPQLEETSQW